MSNNNSLSKKSERNDQNCHETEYEPSNVGYNNLKNTLPDAFW